GNARACPVHSCLPKRHRLTPSRQASAAFGLSRGVNSSAGAELPNALSTARLTVGHRHGRLVLLSGPRVGPSASGEGDHPTNRKGDIDMDTNKTKTLIDNAVAELEAQLRAGKSECLTRFLEVAARFHDYSFRNQLLIAMQRPEATCVAGFQAWKKL